MVDKEAVMRYNTDEARLARLEDAYQAGWLHNVLSRITPLTMRRRDDYIAMADIFVDSPDTANHVLDRFDSDLELFCSVADIIVTKHMTSETVSDELKAHISLYNEICGLFCRKWNIEKRNPIENLVASPILSEMTNPFIKDFMDKRFNRN